jgi:hypothetical protein
METELIARPTLVTLVSMYDASVLDIKQAFQLLQQTSDRMKPYAEYLQLIERRGDDYLHNGETALTNLKRATWRYVIYRTGVRDAMSQVRRNALDEQLTKGELPPFTFDSVMGFLEGLAGSMQQIIAESIEAAARTLRPHDETHKTNGDGWQLGSKAVTKYGVEWDKYCGRFRINYHREGNIASIDNAFHLLDGKGANKYPSNLLTAMRSVMEKNEEAECTTEYFRVKWHKNGNLHWEFKRQDLVDRLNASAADHYHLRKPVGV